MDFPVLTVYGWAKLSASSLAVLSRTTARLSTIDFASSGFLSPGDGGSWPAASYDAAAFGSYYCSSDYATPPSQ